MPSKRIGYQISITVKHHIKAKKEIT
jgi:hypothetical protein